MRSKDTIISDAGGMKGKLFQEAGLTAGRLSVAKQVNQRLLDRSQQRPWARSNVYIRITT